MAQTSLGTAYDGISSLDFSLSQQSEETKVASVDFQAFREGGNGILKQGQDPFKVRSLQLGFDINIVYVPNY